MNAKEIIGGFVLLIFVFLILNKGDASNKIIQGLGGAITNLTKALQGR
jgi:hypothetical protein